jgi:N-acetylneuraminic acid mutarotase
MCKRYARVPPSISDDAAKNPQKNDVHINKKGFGQGKKINNNLIIRIIFLILYPYKYDTSMKTSYIIVAAILYCGSISAQWVQQPAFDGGARESMVGFVIGGIAYVGTGSNTNDLWALDTATGAWTRKADFPGSPRRCAIGFAAGEKGYIGLGCDANGFPRDFYQYDPLTDTWTQMADFPVNGRCAAFSFGLNGKGYVGCGYDGVYNRIDVFEYDPLNNQWIQKNNFGGYGTQHPTSFTIGNYGYAGLGSSGWTCHDEFWKYDPSADTWTQIPDLPGPERSGACAFTIGSKAYCGTGNRFAPSMMNDFYVYDTVTNEWAESDSLPALGRWAGIAFSIGDKGYMGLGQLGSGGNVADFWRFTPPAQPPAGIVEQGNEMNILVYPNPVQTKATIKILNGEVSSLKLVNADGKVIWNAMVSDSVILLDRSGIPAGIYVLLAFDEKGNTINKIKIIFTI